MFFLAFLPQFVDPSLGHIAAQIAIFGLLFVLMGTVAILLTAVSAGPVGRFLRENPYLRRWQSRIVGSIYCSPGVSLVLQER